MSENHNSESDNSNFDLSKIKSRKEIISPDSKGRHSIGGRDKKSSVKEEEFFTRHARSRAKNKHRIFIWSLWVFSIIAIGILLVRVFHYIMPNYLCWLNNEKLSDLDGMLTSGIIGGLLGGFARQINAMMNLPDKI